MAGNIRRLVILLKPRNWTRDGIYRNGEMHSTAAFFTIVVWRSIPKRKLFAAIFEKAHNSKS